MILMKSRSCAAMSHGLSMFSDVALLSRCGEPGSVFDQGHEILSMLYHITISMHINDVSQSGRP